MKKYEAIKAYLDNLTPGELIEVHNSFIDRICIQDYFICAMEMFNDEMEDVPPLDIVRDCLLGEFRPADAYFWTDYLGVIHSSNHPEIDCVDKDEIARHVIEEEDDLGIPELGDILEREEQTMKKRATIGEVITFVVLAVLFNSPIYLYMLGVVPAF